MDCPNGHGEMPSNSVYVEVEGYGADVIVWICQECQYTIAETK